MTTLKDILEHGPSEDMLTLGEDAFIHKFHLEINNPEDADLLREAMSAAFMDMLNKVVKEWEF